MESYTLIRIYFKEGFNILQESEQVIKQEFCRIVNDEINKGLLHCAIVLRNDRTVVESIFNNRGLISRSTFQEGYYDPKS